MSKVVGATSAAQLVLFEMEDRSQSHLIALYDLVPRYVFVARDGGKGSDAAPTKNTYVATVRRDFAFGGREYSVTLHPARIERAARAADVDGGPQADKPRVVDVEVYPGEREQIVETVVRRLAMDRSRLTLTGENRDKVQMRFSLYEIKRELKAVGHALNTSDIREALTILARARIIISRGADPTSRKGRGTNLLEATAFPVLAVRQRADAADDDVDLDVETYLEFNPLVSAAIRNLEFRPVSYEWLMALKSPVSRWLYNRLSVEFDQPVTDGVRSVTLSADEIIKNSGMNEWSRKRDTLRVVTAAVDALVDQGILDSVEKDYTKVGKRIEGIDYTMVPSRRFLDQVRRAERVAEVNAAAIKALTGSDAPPVGFVDIVPRQAAEIRTKRNRRLAAVQESLPLLDTDV